MEVLPAWSESPPALSLLIPTRPSRTRSTLTDTSSIGYFIASLLELFRVEKWGDGSLPALMR